LLPSLADVRLFASCPTSIPGPEYLTVSETARVLRLSVGSVYRAVDAGRLPSVRLAQNGAIRIPISALREREEKGEP
jgi:excisionase family DNA binding protein